MRKAILMTIAEISELPQVERKLDGMFRSLDKYGDKGKWVNGMGRQYFVVNTNYTGGKTYDTDYEVLPIIIE